MVPADVSIVSSCFVVPTKPLCLQRSCVRKQAVTHTVNAGATVCGTYMSIRVDFNNSITRTDNTAPITAFASIRRMSCLILGVLATLRNEIA